MRNIILLILIVLVGTVSVYSANPDWKLSVQAFTFRNFTFFETVDKLADMGVKYIEAYSRQDLGDGLEGNTHYSMDKATRKKVLAKLKSKGVKLISYGVVKGKSEEDWRNIFEFAKEMGIESITSEPKFDQIEMIDKLANEYKITVAIHNHAIPSIYWDPQIVLDNIKGRSKMIGACPDNGHWVRSGLDSVKMFKKLEGKIISIHFKDKDRIGIKEMENLPKKEKKKKYKNRPECVPFGTGIVDLKGIFKELKRQGFKGLFTIEYEANPDDPTADVKKCVDYFNKNAN